MAIRFNESTVRPMGLVAAGVMGIKLKNGDEVRGMDLIPKTGEVFVITSNGIAKRIAVKNFPVQGRYGQGVVAWKLPTDVEIIGLTTGKGTKRVILHLRRLLPKAVRLDSAPLQGRTAQGKSVIAIKPNDRILNLTSPWLVPKPIIKRRSRKSK